MSFLIYCCLRLMFFFLIVIQNVFEFFWFTSVGFCYLIKWIPDEPHEPLSFATYACHDWISFLRFCCKYWPRVSIYLIDDISSDLVLLFLITKRLFQVVYWVTKWWWLSTHLVILIFRQWGQRIQEYRLTGWNVKSMFWMGNDAMIADYSL